MIRPSTSEKEEVSYGQEEESLAKLEKKLGSICHVNSDLNFFHRKQLHADGGDLFCLYKV